MKRKFAVVSIFALVALVSTSGYAETKFKFHRVAQTGMAAPVPSQLSVITSFSFNDQGQAALIADNGLLLKTGGAVTIVAKFGQPAPGGGTFFSFSGPALSANGQLVFRGEVTAPGTSGLFVFSQGKISSLLPDGSPGLNGEGLTPVDPSINNVGDVAFLNSVVGAIYVLRQGSVTRLVGPGDPIPGGAGDTFVQIWPSLSVNHSDQVAFVSFVASTGGTGAFVASGGSVTKIAAPGDVLPDGSVFEFPDTNPSINDLGQVAVALSSSSSRGQIYLFADGQLQLIVPAGSQLTDGSSTNGTFSLSLNNTGQIAFVDFYLRVILLSNGTLTPLARIGGQAPDGDIFAVNNVTLVDARLNNAGQILFGFSESAQADALYLFAGGQVARFAGNGDPVAQPPTLEFPLVAGLAQDGSVLVSDFTFPGGTGLYKSVPDSNGDLVLVAHTGQSFGAGNMITAIFGSTMNQLGQVAISADASATRQAVLLSSSGSIATVADNSTRVNPAGITLGLNNVGEVVFPGYIPDLGQFGFFLSSHGQMTALIDNASQVAPDGSFDDVENPSLNDHGDVAVLVRFPESAAIYEVSQGNLIRVTREGDPTPDGGQLDLPFFDPKMGPHINNRGDLVFVAFDTATVGNTVFLSRNGRLFKIVGPGDRAPGGGTFISVDAPQVNSTGQIVFFGETTHSNASIFVYSGGKVSEVVHAGSRIGNSRLSNVDLQFINDAGDIAFNADLLNGDTAVFVASSRDRARWDQAEPDSDYRSPEFHHKVNQFRARDLQMLQQRKPKAQTDNRFGGGLSHRKSD